MNSIRTLFILLAAIAVVAIVAIRCSAVSAADATTRPSKLLREGSDIVARTGHLQKSTDSPYDRFVFDNAPDVAALAPMRVLPNLQLLSLQTANTEARRDVRFTVWGSVTEYKGENYLLLTNGPEDIERLLPALPSPAGAAAPAAPTVPATQPSADKASLSAQAVFDSMKAPPAAANTAPSASSLAPAPSGGVDATTGSNAVAPGAPALPVRREGSLVIDRLCRMTLSADGLHEELAFDADGAAMQDPPFIILPNLKLTAMENAAAAAVREARFRVTGFVTEYRGRNYILLQKVVVAPDSNLQF